MLTIWLKSRIFPFYYIQMFCRVFTSPRVSLAITLFKKKILLSLYMEVASCKWPNRFLIYNIFRTILFIILSREKLEVMQLWLIFLYVLTLTEITRIISYIIQSYMVNDCDGLFSTET